jgi:hypothetical protein
MKLGRLFLPLLVVFSLAAAGAQSAKTSGENLGRGKPLQLTYRDALRLSIGDGLKDVRSCYINRLLKKSRDRGNITLDWVVDEAGKILSTKVNAELTTIHDDKLAECVRGHAETWVFPPNNGGKDLQFTFAIWFADKGQRIEISLGE